VEATSSRDVDARKFACFALQNLSQDKPCRQEVASTKGVVSALCNRARQGAIIEERLAAMHALKNLTDEPANLIPMTNTRECFATLMKIAHGKDEKESEMMQYLACDALATLSHWLRKIATSGQQMEQEEDDGDDGKEEKKMAEKSNMDLFVPTLKVVTWSQWN
jgi:hypothetical protein